MKIIDLLNKIANGEEVPKKIKYSNKEKEYIYDLDIQDYRCDDTLIFNTLFSNYRTNFFINDEIEILDDEDKNSFTGWKMYQDGKEVCSMDCSPEEDNKIKKINIMPYEKCIHEVTHKEKEILLEIRDIQMKFNELIDKLNNMENNK